MPRRTACAPVVGVNFTSDLCNSIICNRAKGATLTISGLVRANKRDGWLESEARRKLAHTRASLVGNTAKDKDGEALIGLVRGLAIDRERKVAIERILAPPQSELALGV